MGNVHREMQTLRKNKKGMIKIKNSVTKMRKDLDGLFYKLVVAEEKISEPEEKSVETSTAVKGKRE